MEEEILALLVASFTGVRKDGLKQLARVLSLQVQTEDEAKTLIEKLTKEQVDKFVKDYRADVDKEVSEGNKTFETNLKKKYNITDESNENPKKKKEEGGEDDIATIVANAVSSAVRPLQERLEKFEGQNISETRLQALNKKLESCKDEAFKAKALKDYKRMNFDTEEEFNEYLEDTEKDITSANQNVANSTLGGFGRPLAPNKPTSKGATKEELEEVVGRLNI